MRTKHRLDEVFLSALPVPFDDNSKIVFFSDVHRGDGRVSDEFGQNKHIYFHALNYYYQNDFTYVEVGDGDELWEAPKFEYIHTAHTIVFDMLKKFYNNDRLYMLWGNHNILIRNKAYLEKNYYYVPDEYGENNEPLFPDMQTYEGLIFKHRNTGQEIFVVHGHQGDFFNDQFWKITNFGVRYLWGFFHKLGFNYTASPAKNKYRRHKVEKNYSKWNEIQKIMIVCGHTHRPRFPKPGESSYFNSGTCIHPRGIQCLEIVYGKIALINWSMHSKPDGTLYVKRNVSNGPEPLINYSGNELNVDYSKEFVPVGRKNNGKDV